MTSSPEPRFMERAVELALEAVNTGSGGPFGAVIVLDGEIVGEGLNSVLTGNDPTAHAEVCAIRRACERLGRFHLTGAELYSSCEPCPMCLAAAHWARIDRIWYAGTSADAAAVGFDDAHFHDQLRRPAAERDMPAVEFLGGAARPAFEAWAARANKQAY